MKKRRGLVNIIKLYLSFYLNKPFVIVFCVFFILLSLVLFFNIGMPLDKVAYAKNYKGYHSFYFSESLFFIQILNGVFTAFLIGAEVQSFSYYDSMFVTSISRVKLVLGKLLANFLILWSLIVFEVCFLLLFSVLFYPNFALEMRYFLLVFFLSLPLIELLLVGELLSLLISSYFIPIVIFILYFVLLILLRDVDMAKSLTEFVPKIDFSLAYPTLEVNKISYCGICMVLLMAILLFYQKKDINT